MGGTFGETGIRDGSMNWVVGDNVASSIPYFCGWMASGYVVVGDVRDTIETLYQGDGVGTALNAAAFLPAVGDAEKTGNTLRKLATKYPSKISDTGRYLCSVLPGNTPNEVFEIVHDTGFLGRQHLAIDELRDAGKSVPEINAEISVGEKWLIKSANAERITHFNGIPGNLRIYRASVKKTVIGSSWTDSTHPLGFRDVGYNLKANYLHIPDEVWTEPINYKYLDMMIDNGDDIILSIHPDELPEVVKQESFFMKELEYLESNGYRISATKEVDGIYYRMIKV
ncbi:MAG: hypothetical protein M0Q92_07240 [Methanoregula sp.]|jgi:hypothetical protein|nr:hypothetical protein [Methanoregula sp.]